MADNSDNSWKAAHLKLLALVADTCEQHDIPYMLWGETALCAYRDGRLADYPELCIPASDAPRFIEAFRQAGQEHLSLESMLDNPLYAELDILIVDDNTIDFNINAAYRLKAWGLSIRVHLLVRTNNPKRTTQRLNHIQTLQQKSSNFYARLLRGDYHAAASRIGAPASKRAVTLLAKNAYRALQAADSAMGAQGILGSKTIPIEYFSKTQPITVNGTTLRLSADAEGYLTRMFGKRWKKHTVLSYEEDAGLFRSAKHAWRDYEKRLRLIDLNAYAGLKHEYDRLTQKKAPHEDAIQHYYCLLHRTHARFTLRQRLLPEKGDLAKLAAGGEWDAVEERLASYLDEMATCADMGLGLSIDPELFEIAMKTLRETGRASNADRYEELVVCEQERFIRS